MPRLSFFAMQVCRRLKKQVKLVVNNSVSQLIGFSLEQYNQLRSILSYTQSNPNRFGAYSSVRKYLLTKRGEFATGLLYLVEAYIITNDIKVDRQDLRIRPKTRQDGSQSLFIPGRAPTPYPEQIDAAKAACREGTGVVEMPTGVGKTLVCALMCDILQIPTLILVPNLGLKQQTTADLRYWFGDDKVGPATKGVRKFLITVENYDAVDPKLLAKDYGAFIIDEAHHSAAAGLRKLTLKALNNTYFRLGVTATAFRSNPQERLLLESVFSKKVYELPYQTAVQKGYIVPMEVFFIKLPVVKCSGKKFPSVYSELVVNRQDRNEIIASLVSQLDSQGISTLVLTKQVDHGHILKNILETSGISDIGYIHGINQTNRELLLEFNLTERKTLIGTSGCLGEGINSKPAEWIILATTVKSKNLFMQMVGRGARKYTGKTSCKILMFYDASHKYTADHHKACVKYLKDEYGIRPVELKL